MSNERKSLNIFIGLSTVGSAAAGSVALLAGVIILLNGDVVAGGICLVAAALAFGLLSNAVLRQ